MLRDLLLLVTVTESFLNVNETFYDMKMPKIWCKSCPQNAKFNLVAYQRTFIGESEIYVFVRFIFNVWSPSDLYVRAWFVCFY